MATGTLILSAGGLRSLVATAQVAAEADSQKHRPMTIHIADGRGNASARLEHVRRQTAHYRLARLIELSLPGVVDAAGREVTRDEPPPLLHAQLLVIALAQAARVQAARVVFPIAFDADHERITQLTEEVVLAEHLAQLGTDSPPVIEMPLVELTHRQIIELGEQLGVPWHLAWSCLLHGETPCGACPACRTRRSAFHAAGTTDPVDRMAARR